MNEHAHHHHAGHHDAPLETKPTATEKVASADLAGGATIYTCPMHPQIRRPAPGNCPICGMALEPVMPSAEEEKNPELESFTRRFWWTLPLTIVGVVLAMGGHRFMPFSPSVMSWVELALSTPVVLWAGWPFFERSKAIFAGLPARASSRLRRCATCTRTSASH